MRFNAGNAAKVWLCAKNPRLGNGETINAIREIDKKRKGQTMDWTERAVVGAGSCNFCERGQQVEDCPGVVIYPYENVIEIFGNSLTVRICRKCLDEIKKIR